MRIDQIACEALTLEPRDRALLAETIWESLNPLHAFSTDRSEQEAIALARKRDAELDRSEVVSLSHQELMGRLRA